MALLQLGAIVTQISGKVGGQSFVNGSQGTYLKNNGQPNRNATRTQQTRRNNTSTINQHWRTLSNAQRASYTVLAGQYTYINRVGEEKFYNGYQIFMYLNQGRFLIRQPIRNTGNPKTTILIPNYSILDTSFNSMAVIGSNLEVSNTYLLWATNALGSGVNSVNKNLRLISVITRSNLLSGYAFTFDWANRFGAPKVNMKIGYCIQAVKTDSGQRLSRPTAEFFVTT